MNTPDQKPKVNGLYRVKHNQPATNANSWLSYDVRLGWHTPRDNPDYKLIGWFDNDLDKAA